MRRSGYHLAGHSQPTHLDGNSSYIFVPSQTLLAMRIIVPFLVISSIGGSHAFVGGGGVRCWATREFTLQQASASPARIEHREKKERRQSLCCVGSNQQPAQGSVKHAEDGNEVDAAPTATGHFSFAAQTIACTLALATAIVPLSLDRRPAPSLLSGTTTLPRLHTGAAAVAALPPLEAQSYADQVNGNLSPITSVRGVWRVREARTDGSTLPQEPGKLSKNICRGRLSFRGFVGSGKGTVEYKMCGDREGKGRWLTKPKNIINRRITLSARWKVNFQDGTSLIYRGDVFQDEEDEGETPLRVDTGGLTTRPGSGIERPNAHIRGDVFRPITMPQGTLTEKKIGEFVADLIELPTDDDRL